MKTLTVQPTRIPGRWRQGYALDVHTVKSTYLGEDEYGHARFESQRSEIGEYLKRLKYDNDLSVVPDLAETVASFVSWWQIEPNVIVPVPPSRQRDIQPVFLLAEEISRRLGIDVTFNAVKPCKELTELKNVYDFGERLRLLDGAYKIEKDIVNDKRILLFDDLYRSGATMNAVASLLLDQGEASEIYALALTRTRRNL